MKKILDWLIQFPLYPDDGVPFYKLEDHQNRALKSLNNKIRKGIYVQVENKCLCANVNVGKDVIITQKDMAGISVNNILCSKCGLIRSEEIFNDTSCKLFYENEYNAIYYNSSGPSETFFQGQVERGNGFLELIKRLDLLPSISTVFEVGCSMGGNLYPFYEDKKSVSGSDYNEENIDYGKAKGMKLYAGFINDEITSSNSQDLVILSHVMEHFVSIIKDVNKVIEKIRPGKYLLVEVPGIFAVKPYPFYPIWHFQKAHIYNFFYYEYLKVFFTKLGLKVVYGDERCTFVLQKPMDYSPIKDMPEIYDESLKDYPARIEAHLRYKYFILDYFVFLNSVRVKRAIGNALQWVGLKGILKSILRH